MTDNVITKSWKRKACDLVARDIADHIITEDIPEGTVLANEREMIEIYNVGRSTIREALRLLEARGVIIIKTGPSGGVVVRRPRPNDLSESLTLILQFANASLADVFKAREILESALAQLAAKSIKKAQLDELQGTIDVVRKNIKDHKFFLEQNRKFHNLIADAAGSIVLRVFVDTLTSLAGGGAVHVRYSERRRKAVMDAHQHIVDALRNRDSQAAADRMRKHLSDADVFWREKHKHAYFQPVKWLHL